MENRERGEELEVIHLNTTHEDERSDWGSETTIKPEKTNTPSHRELFQRKWRWLCLALSLLSIVSMIVIVVVGEFMFADQGTVDDEERKNRTLDEFALRKGTTD